MPHHKGDLEKEIDGLRRYARLLMRNSTEADDLDQDCLVRALEKWPAIAQVTNLRRYLFSMLHNLFIDGTRKSQRRGTVVPIENAVNVASLIQPEAQTPNLELRDLQNGLANLSDAQREVVLLIGLSGFTYDEAAEITGNPVGTVMSRLSRARHALREHVNGAVIEAPERRAR